MWSEQYKERVRCGMDASLMDCIDCNSSDLSLELQDIQKVLAFKPGTPETGSYRWVISLKDGRFAFISANPDSWGDWDSHDSDVVVRYSDSAVGAALYALVPYRDLRKVNLADESSVLFNRLSILPSKSHTKWSAFLRYYDLLKQIVEQKKTESEVEKRAKELGYL